MTVETFVEEISGISLPNVFNPYRDVCLSCDDSTSPHIRRQNLSLFLHAIVKSDARSLWLGRDLGYRGGRRTGIALTDEFHLDVLSTAFGISGLSKATVDERLMKERTATEVWKLVTRIARPILLWNVFPFHPFDGADPFSNRRHSRGEFDACREILVALIEWLSPDTIIALGADAEAAVVKLGFRCRKVRHPSYGGQADFANQISEIYRLPARTASPRTLSQMSLLPFPG